MSAAVRLQLIMQARKNHFGRKSDLADTTGLNPDRTVRQATSALDSEQAHASDTGDITRRGYPDRDSFINGKWPVNSEGVVLAAIRSLYRLNQQQLQELARQVNQLHNQVGRLTPSR